MSDTAPPFNREREFLLLISRPGLQAADRDRLAELARLVEWTPLLEAAAFHLLEPALWRQVASLAEVPDNIKANLRLANMASSARNLRLMAATTSLHERFREAGIQTLFFKGPILAIEAYGGASGRGFSDVDLLVRCADAASAMEILEASGYLPLFPVTGHWKSRYLRRFYELTFRDARGVLVDLHWSLLDPQFSFCPTEDEVWKDVRPVELNGAHLQTLSIEMTAKYLCLHVAKHHWDRVGWLADVVHWMVRHPGVDWTKLGTEPKTGRFIRITLGLAERLLGVPLPQGVSSLVERDPIVRQQIDSVEARVLRSSTQTVTRSAHWRTEFARAMPTSRDRWRSFFTTLFRPSVKEWLAVPLPEAFSPLYAVIRPCRLVWKRLSGSNADPT